MSAYLNKNTFSSATALPPEENRLNMQDIIAKSQNSIWKVDNEAQPGTFERLRNEKYEIDEISNLHLRNKRRRREEKKIGCGKCGLSKTYLF